MRVYIYKDNWISIDEELINEKMFDELAQNVHSVGAIERAIDWEWDNVEEEECTQDEIDNYIKNGYIFLGKR